MRVGPFGRGYIYQQDRYPERFGILHDEFRNNWHDNLYNYGYLAFGNGTSFNEAECTAGPILASSSYRPPNVVVDIAVDKFGKRNYEVKRKNVSNFYYFNPNYAAPAGNIYYYVTPYYVMGSLQQRVRMAGGGIQMELAFPTSPEAVIFSYNGGKHMGQYIPWIGEGEIHYQYKHFMIGTWKNVYYADTIDEIVKDGDWTFLKEGEAYIAHRQNIDTKDGLEFLEVGLAQDFDSFEDFISKMKSNPLDFDSWTNTLTYTTSQGDVIAFKDLSWLRDIWERTTHFFYRVWGHLCQQFPKIRDFLRRTNLAIKLDYTKDKRIFKVNGLKIDYSSWILCL